MKKSLIIIFCVLLSALFVAAGDVIVKNGEVNATENITADYYFGDGSQLTGITDTNTNCSSNNSCSLVVYDDELTYTVDTDTNLTGTDVMTYVNGSNVNFVKLVLTDTLTSTHIWQTGNFHTTGSIDYQGGDSSSLDIIGGTSGTTAGNLHLTGPAHGASGSIFYDATTHRFRNLSGTEWVRISSTGNVGIGETNPAAKLDVAGTLNVNDTFNVDGSSTMGQINMDGNFHVARVDPTVYITDTDGDGSIIGQRAGRLYFWNSSWVQVMVLDTVNNRVGIGTGNPGALLDVQSASNPTILLTDTTTPVTTKIVSGDSIGLVGTLTDHDFRLRTGNVDRVSVQAGGNVGIGLTAPTARLEVKANASSVYAVKVTASDGSALGGFYEGSSGGGKLIIKDAAGATKAALSSYDDTSHVMNNFGIGTAAPSHELNVVGDSNVTGDSIVGGDLTVDDTIFGGVLSLVLGFDLSNLITIASNLITLDLNGVSEYQFTGTYFAPTTAQDGYNGLGQPAKRWENVYSVDGDFSGDVDVGGRIVSGYVEINSSSDAVDVSGVNTVMVNTAGGSITLGGLADGVEGQVVHIFKRYSANNMIIEHNEGGVTDAFLIHGGADLTFTGYGGVTAVFSDSYWNVVSD